MLAWRNLVHDKIRLAVTITGIVFAVVLIVVELGLFVGFTTTTSGLIDRATARRSPHVTTPMPSARRRSSCSHVLYAVTSMRLSATTRSSSLRERRGRALALIGREDEDQ